MIFSFGSSIFVDQSIDFTIGFDISLLSNVFRTCVFIVVFL